MNADDWVEEEQAIGTFLARFGDRLPAPIRQEHKSLGERLSEFSIATK